MDKPKPTRHVPLGAEDHSKALAAVAEAAEASRQARLLYEWRVYLAHAQGASATRIAERAGVSRQRITQMLAEIERNPAHAERLDHLRNLQRGWSMLVEMETADTFVQDVGVDNFIDFLTAKTPEAKKELIRKMIPDLPPNQEKKKRGK